MMKKIFLLPLLFLLASCQITSAETIRTALPGPSVMSQVTMPEDSDAEDDEIIQEETSADLSYAPKIYRIEEIGFEIQYPIDWMVDEGVLGSRAFGASLTSWQHPAGQIEEVPEGETITSVTIYQWDPKNVLDAYIQTRMRDAWSASGIQILSEEEIILGGDREAMIFTVRNEADMGEAFFLAALAGDDYLVLSGSGDLGLLKEIALTGRFTN